MCLNEHIIEPFSIANLKSFKLHLKSSLMIKQYFVIIIFIFFIFDESLAQNIYPEKMEGCNTEHFALESDSTTAKKDSRDIIELVTRNWQPEITDKIRGVLKIQVIAYEDKSSCLISFENNTNINNETLNLHKMKTLIDNELIWDEVDKTVSPMIELKFNKDQIILSRFGMNGKKGFHKLTD